MPGWGTSMRRSDLKPQSIRAPTWNAMEQAFELLNRETGKLWNDLLSGPSSDC